MQDKNETLQKELQIKNSITQEKETDISIPSSNNSSSAKTPPLTPTQNPTLPSMTVMPPSDSILPPQTVPPLVPIPPPQASNSGVFQSQAPCPTQSVPMMQPSIPPYYAPYASTYVNADLPKQSSYPSQFHPNFIPLPTQGYFQPPPISIDNTKEMMSSFKTIDVLVGEKLAFTAWKSDDAAHLYSYHVWKDLIVVVDPPTFQSANNPIPPHLQSSDRALFAALKLSMDADTKKLISKGISGGLALMDAHPHAPQLCLIWM
mmetsp:Transcript_6306/g.9164  ORF Transcript_6306/g.9164 Transcript_6306/m.9164 type:complete len:261 (+) Transcript_6306:547-1329(+)